SDLLDPANESGAVAAPANASTAAEISNTKFLPRMVISFLRGAAAYVAPLFMAQIFARGAGISQGISLPTDGT
ncbi:MAG TPA: hypothetical protein VFQ26_00765, partial [Nitrospiraceae bacterium]|nr:hypothetical protein [Nitrospiraceae bacterium]